jgi:hypothetical protein
MMVRRSLQSTLGKEFAMHMLWKTSLVTVASIAIGIAVGAGCGSDEKAGNGANKRGPEAVESAKAKGAAKGTPKAGRKKTVDAPWLKTPLNGIELSRVQARKIEKIVAERTKSIEARAQLRETLAKSAKTENNEKLEQLTGALKDVEGSSWMTKVRAVLKKAQADKFDANNEG